MALEEGDTTNTQPNEGGWALEPPELGVLKEGPPRVERRKRGAAFGRLALFEASSEFCRILLI